jgi:Fe-S cluster biogenesis protein NfuA
MSDDLRAQVAALMESLRPLFAEDGIEIELLGVRGGVVSVHVDSSGCTGCASPQEVLEAGLCRLIQEKVTGVTSVIAL